MNLSGPALALLSASLFGVSPVLVKIVIGEVSPVLLAGLLYLGSGVGLLIFSLFKEKDILTELKALSAQHHLKLMGATLSGGILAPICLTYAIQWASAFEVSLLLNLESVMTTLIAAWVFHEHIGKRVWMGKILLISGGLLITLRSDGNTTFSAPAFLVILACFLWGIDNNLTRDVDELSPSTMACVKGLVAGIWNTVFAGLLGQGTVTIQNTLLTLVIGAFCYGASLVLFVYALRMIGSSRTSTYFASGPFVGMMLSILFLGEHPPLSHWGASMIMLAGVWALYRENHSHSHVHEAFGHHHIHTHDLHHQHVHDGTEGPEPHDHFHIHEHITHEHVHWPDIHHRHSH